MVIRDLTYSHLPFQSSLISFHLTSCIASGHFTPDMDNASDEAGGGARPVSVMAITRHFEALSQSRRRSNSLADVLTPAKAPIETSGRCRPKQTPPAPSPRSPSRFQPNTYQSTVVTEYRKKFKVNVHEYDHSDPEAGHHSQLSPAPPPKPQRTFDHDVYVQCKEEIRALVDQKFRGKGRGGVQNRRRSRSADASIDIMFDQATPLTAIKRIIRTSFGENDALSPLAESAIDFDCDDQYDSHEGDEAARLYARTLRCGLKKGMISHYSTMTGLTGEARLCMYVTIYDKQSDSVALHPGSSDVQKPDYVKKFLSQTCRTKNDKFCWFANTEQIFIYTYFISSENRAIALSSHLFSPQFFSDLLKAVAADSPTSLPLGQVAHELVSKKIPLPGDTFSLNGRQIPVPWQMPQVTVSQPSLLLTHIEPEIIVKSVATLVQEKRLVFVSRNASLLVDVSKSLMSLIYPLAWDYMYWPYVPDDLVTMCAAFTLPYFVCLHPKQLRSFEAALMQRSRKIMIVDLDTRCIRQETGEEDRILPKEYSRCATKALRLSCTMTDLSQCLRDKAVEETFTELFSLLLGPVTPHISDVTFCKNTFVRSLRNKDLRSFFSWFSETRLFDNFVKYWQLRVMHCKYIPVAEKRRHMDRFERRTEVMSLKMEKKVLPEKQSTGGTSGWSNTAIRKVEKKMKLLGDRLKKHM